MKKNISIAKTTIYKIKDNRSMRDTTYETGTELKLMIHEELFKIKI